MKRLDDPYWRGMGGGGDVLADASHDVRKDDKSDESQGRKREEEGMC